MVCLLCGREHLGEMELAATNVIRSISTLFFVIVNSLAATTGSLVGNLLGAGQKDQVVPLCNRVIRLGYAVGGPLIILSIVCWFSAFIPETGIYADCSPAVYSSPVELCFCPARLCIYECRNRNRCHSYDFHFSGSDHHCLPDLSMVCKLRQYIPFRILDS